MITIVGEAPSRSSDPRRPFDGYSGKKLAEYAGLAGYEELASRACLVNLMRRWPGPGYAGEKGSAFPVDRARRAAKRLTRDVLRPNGGAILFAGKRVARAFDLELDYFGWVPFERGSACVVPHPSGVNHWWNDAKNHRRACRFLRGVFAAEVYEWAS